MNFIEFINFSSLSKESFWLLWKTSFAGLPEDGTMCMQQELWYYNYTTNNSTFHHRRLSVILEALTLLLILTVALSANLFAIVAILKSYNGRNIHYIFILNLFITDLGITLACMMFALYDVFNPGYIKCFDLLCKVSWRHHISFHFQFNHVITYSILSLCWSDTLNRQINFTNDI